MVWFELASRGIRGHWRPSFIQTTLLWVQVFARFFQVLLQGLPCLAILACASDAPTVLQASDFEPMAGRTLHPGLIIESDVEFEDAAGVDEAKIQAFLLKTPYGRSSFLSTYASEGLLASAAIRRTALRHQISPIVLLAKIQAVQGLIGERFYPDAPARVEYLFGCGCNGGGTCDPSYAGLSRQLDCFAANLRATLNAQVAAAAMGTEVDGTFTTVDGVRVTPQNAATAAVYAWEPRLDLGKGGAWMVWNLWGKYAKALEYQNQASTQAIGSPCQLNVNCKQDAFVCLPRPTGGVCSARCADSSGCENSVCIALNAPDLPKSQGYCLVACEMEAANTCPADLSCQTRRELGTAQTKAVCALP